MAPAWRVGEMGSAGPTIEPLFLNFVDGDVHFGIEHGMVQLGGCYRLGILRCGPFGGDFTVL